MISNNTVLKGAPCLLYNEYDIVIATNDPPVSATWSFIYRIRFISRLIIAAVIKSQDATV